MILVAGDVCQDVMLYGHSLRFSRDTPALPILDIDERIVYEGGAAAAYRQVKALGAEAFLAPTGAPGIKTRLVARSHERDREIARFDMAWPPQDPQTFGEILSAGPSDFAAVVYSQYRPGPPAAAILRHLKRRQLRVGDVRDPSHFAGVLDVVKVSAEDMWQRLEHPRPPMNLAGARKVARVVLELYGFELAIITLGRDGYVAALDSGTDIAEGGLDGGIRSVGAGDVFTGTLAVMLAEGREVREALGLANRAAGLACRRDEHLPTVDREELAL